MNFFPLFVQKSDLSDLFFTLSPVWFFEIGPIGASIVAMSPRNMLDLNPALAMGKPSFESKGPPITAKDCKQNDSGGKNFL